jgi:hypothetical protein
MILLPRPSWKHWHPHFSIIVTHHPSSKSQWPVAELWELKPLFRLKTSIQSMMLRKWDHFNPQLDSLFDLLLQMASLSHSKIANAPKGPATIVQSVTLSTSLGQD